MAHSNRSVFRDTKIEGLLGLVNPVVFGTLLAAFFALPLLALLTLSLSGNGEYFAHIASTRLPHFLYESGQLAVISGMAAALIGVASAWLITRFDFPGRNILSWLLILPLAMPGYVAAYSWYSLTAPGGKMVSSIGFSLPTVSGVFGAGFVFAFTLYLGFLVAPIIQMGNIGSQITEAFAGLDRMEEILNTTTEEDEDLRRPKLEDVLGNLEHPEHLDDLGDLEYLENLEYQTLLVVQLNTPMYRKLDHCDFLE